MKIFYWFIFIFIFSSTRISAQGREINFSNFDYKNIEELVFNGLNRVRDSLILQPLLKDSILTLAAKSQVEYINKNQHLTHTQVEEDLHTVEDRVFFYKGTHEYLNENIDQVLIDKPNLIYKETLPFKARTYEDAAYFFIKNCINVYSNYSNLVSKVHYTIGLSFSVDPTKKAIYTTMVFGSLPYKVPESIKSKNNKKLFYPSKRENEDNAFGIKPYLDKECSKCVTAFKEIPDYIPNKIFVEENKIYYFFGDLELFKKTFNDGKYSISVDLVQKNQFPCYEGNILHHSPVHDGLMYRPIDLGTLLKRNEKKDQDQLQVYIGDVPPEISGDFECNLILIKDGYACGSFVEKTIYLHKESKLLPNKLFIDTVPSSEILKTETMKFTIDLEKDVENISRFTYNHYQDTIYHKLTDSSKFALQDSIITVTKIHYPVIKALYDSLQLYNYRIKEIVVSQFHSIDEDKETNQEIRRKSINEILRNFQSYQHDSIKTNIKQFENWDQFYIDIKNTPYNYLSTLNKKLIKTKIHEDTLSRALKPILQTHRKAIFTLKLIEKIDSSKNNIELINDFSKAIQAHNVPQASALQKKLFEAVHKGQLSYENVRKVSIPKEKEFAQILNNDIIFRYYLGTNEDHASQLDEVSDLDMDNEYIKFNLYDLTLREWSDSVQYLSSPEHFIKKIKTLYSGSIDKKLINRLYINYYILVTSYYKNNAKYKFRGEATNLVKKYYTAVDLSQEDILSLANYFVDNNHSDFALELMYPYIQRGEYTEDILFTFLSFALWNQQYNQKKEFSNAQLIAKEINNERFCRMFGYPKLRFQLLKDENLKRNYCNTCQ